MKLNIYLAGLISTDYPESLLWRKIASERIRELGHNPISPMAGKKNLAKQTTDGGITSKVATSKGIILRDYRDLRRADVIVANLETFGCRRPLVGTLFELAWAWQLNVPVVAIVAPDNYLFRQHPFISESVAFFKETVIHAVETACDYFGAETE